MRPNVLPILFLLVASACGSAAAPRPTRVTIIDVPHQRRGAGTNIGNVKVRFSDGHSEVWTSLGRCMYARVSSTGLVGWTRYNNRNHWGEPVNITLRVRFLDGRIRDFEWGPFIEEWMFLDRDTAVAIKARGRHGPARYAKYDLRTGKLIEAFGSATNLPQTPAWALPLLD